MKLVALATLPLFVGACVPGPPPPLYIPVIRYIERPSRSPSAGNDAQIREHIDNLRRLLDPEGLPTETPDMP